MNLSTQPPKGTSDWLPEEYQIRKYIFDTWRRVALSFGYEEYLTPLLENAEIYRAKSGEDVGGKELMVMTDRAGRELAIRPEMTPSITRVIAERYESMPKPIRMFSIANFFRNEKPQRGRNREFWQLNADIFGSNSLSADLEVIQLALDIMLAFDPPKYSFVLYINDRRLVNKFVREYLKVGEENVVQVIRILDKFSKLPTSEFVEQLKLAGATIEDQSELIAFLDRDDATMRKLETQLFAGEPAMEEMGKLATELADLGYGEYIKWNPSLMRGFDYYDGMVFEVFDLNPENPRALFGGGRYNGLAQIFGRDSFPAVGFAPGDETTRLFLESWGLLDGIKEMVKLEKYYLPILTENVRKEASGLAKKLRGEGKLVELGLEVQSLGKALEYANKKGISYVVILGEDEVSRREYIVKDMSSGEQEVFTR